MEFILQPWAWYVAGPIIALCMFLMFFFGKKFGVSSNLETVCAMGGAGKFVDFFKFDWKKNKWNLVFVIGLILGGYFANEWITPDQTVAISPQTIESLSEIGIDHSDSGYMPNEIFSVETMLSAKGFIVLLIAGVLVGFGARYAGGCTSGHGIVGLSSLSVESFIAVAGFFIGGLIMTWLILPHIF